MPTNGSIRDFGFVLILRFSLGYSLDVYPEDHLAEILEKYSIIDAKGKAR